MFNENEIFNLIRAVRDFGSDGICIISKRIIALYETGLLVIKVVSMGECKNMLIVKYGTNPDWFINEVIWKPTYPEWREVKKWLKEVKK